MRQLIATLGGGQVRQPREIATAPCTGATLSKPVPAEGQDGLFIESWFPVCTSQAVVPGAVVGPPFLDGRIVIFRGDDGMATVMFAYCPHLGADLAAGKVVDNRIRCAFHRWEFDTAAGVGERVSAIRCLLMRLASPPSSIPRSASPGRHRLIRPAAHPRNSTCRPETRPRHPQRCRCVRPRGHSRL